MPIYKKFATVYDQMDADLHSKRMVPYCKKILKKFKIKPSSGLDLCCGTGSAILEFEKSGIKMSGLDQSAEMLAIAAKKTKRYKMSDQAYLALREYLDNFPLGFPETESGVELKILKRLFKPDEAELVVKLRSQEEEDECTACEICLDRCLVEAIFVDDLAVIHDDKCLG